MASAAAALALASLVVGSPARTTHTVSGGAVRSLRIELAASQFVRCTINQGAEDLRIAVVGPDGRQRSVHDQRERGEEPVSVVADVPGAYLLQVRSAGSRRAVFHANCGETSGIGPEQRQRVEAETLTTTARDALRRRDRGADAAALTDFRRALSLWEQLGDAPGRVLALTGAGDALYRQGAFAAADTSLRLALDISRAIGDSEAEAATLTSLAAVVRPLGQFSTALDLLDAALVLYRREPRNHLGEGIALSNRGILLREIGELDAARQHYTRALRLLRSERATAAEAIARNNLAITLEQLGQPESALAELRQALALAERARDGRAIARMRLSQARVQLTLGERALALRTAQDALRRTRLVGDGLAEADAILQVGRVHVASGHIPEARSAFATASMVYRALQHPKGQSTADHELGVIELAAGDVPAALAALNRALVVRRTLGVKSLQAETLIRKAEAERRSLEFVAAAGSADEAITIAEGLHAAVFERELRLSYFASLHRYHREAIDIAMAAYRHGGDAAWLARALQWSEHAKARDLLVAVRASQAQFTPAGEPDLLARERQLRGAINYWSNELWRRADRQQPANAAADPEERLDAAVREHAGVEAAIRRADPRYALLHAPPSSSVTDMRRALLDDRTVLIEYVLGAERSYAFALTTDELIAVDLPARAVIERLGQRFYELVSAGTEGPPAAAAREALARAGAALGDRILAPLAGVLRGKRRVIIVADGALHYVPFAALPADARTREPLIVTHEVVSAPSATVAYS